MQTDVKQVFYFQADANSVGGFLEEPFRVVPSPTSVSLSPTGGSATADGKEFSFEEGISVTASRTHVSGRPLGRNGPWKQRVVSVVEGFNLLGRITADRLTAQMFIEQPSAGGGPRRISFAGSHITNLRIDGKPVTPVLDDTLLPQHPRDEDDYDRDSQFSPELEWPALRTHARRQSLGLLKLENAPAWTRERFGWTGAEPRDGTAGLTFCSLLSRIEGVASGQSFAHCIELPDFGRIFLAEVTILPYSARLTMLRAELGCKVSGHVSAAAIGSNGTTMPPN